MNKSEPALVPQWLRSSESVSGNGTSVNPLASSSLRPDGQLKSKVARLNSLSNNDQNIKRSSVSERITSSYFRRSSSTNGSDNSRTSSSFSRNHRDRDWDGDACESSLRDRSMMGDYRRLDYPDPLGNCMLSRVDKKILTRSQSMVSDQRGETWPRKVETGSKSPYKVNGLDSNRTTDNGLLHKASFEQDFPSLGVEEKSASTEIKRVPSPGLSPAIHSFPVVVSTMIGSDKWTSALAEVPGVVRSNEGGPVAAKAADLSLISVSTSVLSGPSMAETVAHGSPRLQTVPQLSAETQRQELAIKQSRQLIPVTPSLPKALVSNLPEKQKSKTGLPLLVHSPRASSLKPDLSKASNIGKLQVLKPVWERNGTPHIAKDSSSPTSGNKPLSSAPAAVQSVAGSSSLRPQSINSAHPAAEHKHVSPLLEKRAVSQSQTRSRSDFFSLMRKKSILNSSSASESSHETPSSDKFSEGDNTTHPATHQSEEDMVLNDINGLGSSDNRDVVAEEADSCSRQYLSNGKNGSSHNSIFFSEEEEAAFLRSLGWEENTEEGGLTDEEINAFYRDATNKLINAKPSWKIS